MANGVIMSIWRNDTARFLPQRVAHLLSKKHHGGLRWVWVVGDSDDETEHYLRCVQMIHREKDIEIVRHDTNIVGNEPPIRMRRLSETVNAGFDRVRSNDDFWIMHESDLISPPDLIRQLRLMGTEVNAGWVWLGGVFYDTWAYRANGQNFSNHAPYHPIYRDDKVFEVDSAGSVLMFPANELRAGVRCEKMAVVELCEKMKARGRRFYVNPMIHIYQPISLWEVHAHA
jgi:hypothetical protein